MTNILQCITHRPARTHKRAPPSGALPSQNLRRSPWLSGPARGPGGPLHSTSDSRFHFTMRRASLLRCTSAHASRTRNVLHLSLNKCVQPMIPEPRPHRCARGPITGRHLHACIQMWGEHIMLSVNKPFLHACCSHMPHPQTPASRPAPQLIADPSRCASPLGGSQAALLPATGCAALPCQPPSAHACPATPSQ